MSREFRLTAGILLILIPTVVFGGASILSMLVGDPAYAENVLRQDLWRVGHAHAGVLLVLSLTTLRYVDEANLSKDTEAVGAALDPGCGDPASCGLLPLGHLPRRNEAQRRDLPRMRRRGLVGRGLAGPRCRHDSKRANIARHERCSSGRKGKL